MRRPFGGIQAVVAVLTILPQLAVAQDAKPGEVLTVDGYRGEIPVVMVNGKAQIEVEALARLTKGSISYGENRITLTIPPPEPSDAKPQTGFSPEFLRASLEVVTEIREWRAALRHAVRNNFPVTDDWIDTYRTTLDGRLALASGVATTDGDRNALPLLTSSQNLMRKLNDNYQALYKSATYVTADSYDRDPLDRQVMDCAQGLGSVLAAGRYQDVSGCH